MQQRMRAAYDALYDDLAAAGSGPVRRQDEGSFGVTVAPIVPFRSGLRGGDPPATFKGDVLTVMYAPPAATETTIRQPLPAHSDVVTLDIQPGCPLGDPLCGFAEGMDVLIVAGDGSFDTFTVSAVAPPRLALRHNGVDWSRVYPAGSRIIQIVTRTYYLRGADSGRPPQLTRYDGGIRPDVAVIDHVAALSFGPSRIRRRRGCNGRCPSLTDRGPPTVHRRRWTTPRESQAAPDRMCCFWQTAGLLRRLALPRSVPAAQRWCDCCPTSSPMARGVPTTPHQTVSMPICCEFAASASRFGSSRRWRRCAGRPVLVRERRDGDRHNPLRAGHPGPFPGHSPRACRGTLK